MEHYRPFRYTLTAHAKRRGRSSRRHRVFFFGLGIAIFFAAANENARAKDYLWKVQDSGNTFSTSLSDDDIINAVNGRLKREALQQIANEYGDLDRLSSDPLAQLRAMAPATAAPLVACSLNAPRERDACINKVKSDLRAERAAKIRNIQNGDFGTVFIYSVLSKTNYEGNYIAVVNIRRRGTDKTWQWKLLLQAKNGSWVITDKQEKEVK